MALIEREALLAAYDAAHKGPPGKTRKLIEEAPVVEAEPVIHAVWQYYTNDEGKARWRCGNCGKVCKHDPYYKARCSRCWAHMRKEA